MGDLQDPRDGGTSVPYFRPYFVGIFPHIGLYCKYGRYLQFRFPKWPVIKIVFLDYESSKPDIAMKQRSKPNTCLYMCTFQIFNYTRCFLGMNMQTTNLMSLESTE